MIRRETLDILGTFEEKGYLTPPQIVGNIAMIGLLDPESPGPIVKTLREGLKDGSILVEERGGYTDLYVRTSQPVMIRRGQAVIKGGRQDRIFKGSQVVMPTSGRSLDVYCIEHGRWGMKESQWETAEIPTPFRRMAEKGVSQSQMWGNISQYLQQQRVSSRSDALSEIYDALGEEFEKFVGNFEWWRNQVGMIVFINGVVAGMEVFDSFETFHEEGMSLLRESYIPEGLRGDKIPMLPVDVERAYRTFKDQLQSGARNPDMVVYQDRIVYLGVV